MEVIEVCPIQHGKEREEYWIEEKKPLYNIVRPIEHAAKRQEAKDKKDQQRRMTEFVKRFNGFSSSLSGSQGGV